MRKLDLQAIAKILGTNCSYSTSIQGVSVDSRLIQPGQLFFALTGEKTEGSKFLSDVAKKGATAAVVPASYTDSDYGLTLLRVQDPLRALQKLAQDIIAKSKSRIVAVTGSVGKTTTKDFITTVLKEKYRVASSPGNSNSQIGIPLTALNYTDGTEDILVLEMGMTHRGNLTQLLNIAPPECAVITHVALVHACNFDSLEEIAYTKAEILLHPQTKLGIVNRDIPKYEAIQNMGHCKKVSFSFNSTSADYRIGPNTTEFEIYETGIPYNLGRFPLPGNHHKTNFLAAIACARYFGLNWQEISTGMQKIQLPELRGDVIVKEGITFINDSYNAAPVSIKAALDHFPSPKKGGRKIAVFADMLELGKFSEASHKEVGEYALNLIDIMFCCGNESRHIYDCWQKVGRTAHWFAKREELARVLKSYLQSGDIVLIKGSRGTQISKLLEDMEAISK